MGIITINLNALKRYDVALSFAEENRAIVETVAGLLKERNIKVFYDDDLRTDTWGQDLATYLDRVYRLQARFCVVFVSMDYERKRWTKFEIERARARSYFKKGQAYVLPYLLDEGEYAAQFRDVGYFSTTTHDEEQLAQAIADKLDKQPQRRLVLWLRNLFRNRNRLAVLMGLTAGSGLLLLEDQLTPVDTLARKIYERSKYTVAGSVCKDGEFRKSQGQGTCSSHGGVAYSLDTVLYHKTEMESRKEAEVTSWHAP